MSEHLLIHECLIYVDRESTRRSVLSAMLAWPISGAWPSFCCRCAVVCCGEKDHVDDTRPLEFILTFWAFGFQRLYRYNKTYTHTHTQTRNGVALCVFFSSSVVVLRRPRFISFFPFTSVVYSAVYCAVNRNIKKDRNFSLRFVLYFFWTIVISVNYTSFFMITGTRAFSPFFRWILHHKNTKLFYPRLTSSAKNKCTYAKRE